MKRQSGRRVQRSTKLASEWTSCRMPSSQQRRFHTMPSSKKGSVNRRGFLKGAAAGAAALVTKPSATHAETAGPAAQAAQARTAATPTPLPSAALVAAETSPPPRADVYTTDRPGSVFIQDVIKCLGIEFV